MYHTLVLATYKALENFLVVWSGGVVESDYSVSYLSEKESRERERELDIRDGT